MSFRPNIERGLTTRALAVTVVAALCLSVVFAGLAFFSPVKSLSTVCERSVYCTRYCSGAPGNNCLSSLELYYPKVILPLLTYWSYVQIAEGLAVSGIILAVLLMQPPAPSFLSRSFRLPKALRVSVLLASFVLAILYLWMVTLDLMWHIPPQSQYAMQSIAAYFSCLHLQTASSVLGTVGFLCFVGAAIGFVAYGLDKGALRAVRDALVFFATPATLTLQGGLLLFDRNQMTTHVTLLVPWSLGGVDIVSNWFVLVVTLVMLSYAPFAFDVGINR